jgi:hypothetical protein
MKRFCSVGEAWLYLVEAIVRNGSAMGEEGLELVGTSLVFPAAMDNDPIIERFGEGAMISAMRRVFFGSRGGRLNHSYADLMRGPSGRTDLEDVVALLRAEPWSKRGVVMLCGRGDGQVPCINTVQFLVRNDLHTVYFARGQDAFRKFYADALCIGDMAKKVAADLGVKTGSISGFIGSCHIYHKDRQAIDRLLQEANPSASRAGIRRPSAKPRSSTRRRRTESRES